MSAEGEQLPWVVVLRSEDAVAGPHAGLGSQVFSKSDLDFSDALSSTGCAVKVNNDVLVADQLQKPLNHQVRH